MALLRLRQLNKDDDYDWLAAMAEQPKSDWELRREAEQHSRETMLENARVATLLGTEPPVRRDGERYGEWGDDAHRGRYDAWGHEPHLASALDRYSGEVGHREF